MRSTTERVRVLFVVAGSALNRGMATGLENLAWRLSEDGCFDVSVFAGGTRPSRETTFTRAHKQELARVHYVFADHVYPSREFSRSLRETLLRLGPDVVVGWTRTVAHLPVRHLGRRLRPSRFPSQYPTVIVNEGEDLRGFGRVRLLRATYPTLFRFALHAIGQISRGKIGPLGEISLAIGISESVALSLARAYGISTRRIRTVHRGVDTDLFRPTGHPNRTVESQSLITTGNIVPNKGYGEVAAALRHVRVPVKWTVVGKGDNRYVSILAEEVSRAGHVLHHVPPLPHRDLAPILRKHSFFVLLSWAEGISKSLLEAMASGCIPIVSDIPAFREVVRDGVTGFIAPSTPEQVGQRLESLVASEDLDDVRRAARELIVERFSSGSEVAEWKRAIASALQSEAHTS